MNFNKKERLIFKAINALDVPTCNSISDHVGLSRVLVSSILTEMKAKQYIAEEGKTKQGSGRPSHIYEISAQVVRTLGISMGRDAIHWVSLDSRGTAIDSGMIEGGLASIDVLDDDALLGLLKPIVADHASDKDGKGPLGSIGISIPGIVDYQSGLWLHDFRHPRFIPKPLKVLVEKAFSTKTIVEDAARSITYQFYRAEKSIGEPLIYIYLGDGVGTGIIINDALFRGADGLAGEVGHITVNPSGIRCSCGNIGCLETVVSTPNVLRQIRDRLQEGVFSSLHGVSDGDYSQIGADVIVAAAKEGDKLAESTLYEIGEYLADAVILLTKLFNPRSIVLGGPGSVYGNYYTTPIELKMRQFVRTEMLSHLRVYIASYESHQEAAGAGLLALDEYWNNL